MSFSCLDLCLTRPDGEGFALQLANVVLFGFLNFGLLIRLDGDLSGFPLRKLGRLHQIPCHVVSPTPSMTFCIGDDSSPNSDYASFIPISVGPSSLEVYSEVHSVHRPFLLFFGVSVRLTQGVEVRASLSLSDPVIPYAVIALD